MSQVKLDLLNLYCFHFLKSIIYTTVTVYNDILCVPTPLDQYHDNVLHAMMTDRQLLHIEGIDLLGI